MNPRFKVLCGMPASGKSQYAATQLHGWTVCSADDIKTGTAPFAAFHAMYQQAATALRAHHRVCIDACSLLPHERARLLRTADEHRVAAELVFFCVPWRVCRERNAHRMPSVDVDWELMRKRATAAFVATRREAWSCITYVPTRDASFTALGWS